MKLFYKIIIFIIFLPATAINAVELAHITEIYGVVELHPLYESKSRPAQINEAIVPGAIITTGFKSQTRINVGNSQVVIMELSRIILEEIRITVHIDGTIAEKIVIELASGALRVSLKSPPRGKSTFILKTDNHEIRAQNTAEFYSDSTTVEVFKEHVFFIKPDGQQFIVKNQKKKGLQ